MKMSPASAETQRVKVASCKKKLFVDMLSLPWLMTYMREEVRLQGVPEIQPAPCHDQNSRITFNFRDESYTARVLLTSGKSQTRVAYLKKRVRSDGDLSHLSRDRACEVIIQELKEWQKEILLSDGQVPSDAPVP